MSRIFSCLLIGLITATIPYGVFAQSESSVDGMPTPTDYPTHTPYVPKTDSPLQCTDFYRDGSVVVDIQTELSQSVPGATLLFEGILVNQNTYPITEGVLSAKVYRQIGSTTKEVVDQFIVKEGITLLPQSEQPVTHEWVVPVNLSGGTYSVGYFLSAGSFSLVGDNHLNVTPSFTRPIEITSDFTTVTFLQSTLSINGVLHDVSSAEPYEIQNGEEVTIKTILSNPTDEVKKVPLQWIQYGSDVAGTSDKKDTKTELITLEPGERKEVSYTPIIQFEPTTYVVASVLDNEVKHILDIIITNQQIDNIRLQIAGISEYPLVSGQEKTLFACVEGFNRYSIGGVTIHQLLKTTEGELVHEYTHTGTIRPGLGGFGESFTPNSDSNNLLLVTMIERDGKIVSTATTSYGCIELGASPCVQEKVFDQRSLLAFFKQPHILTAVGGVILLLVGFGWYILRRRRRERMGQNSIIDGLEMTLPKE